MWLYRPSPCHRRNQHQCNYSRTILGRNLAVTSQQRPFLAHERHHRYLDSPEDHVQSGSTNTGALSCDHDTDPERADGELLNANTNSTNQYWPTPAMEPPPIVETGASACLHKAASGGAVQRRSRGMESPRGGGQGNGLGTGWRRLAIDRVYHGHTELLPPAGVFPEQRVLDDHSGRRYASQTLERT